MGRWHWWPAFVLGIALGGCAAPAALHANRDTADASACLPAQMTLAHITGTVVASYAMRPGLSSVRLQTRHGEVVLYWHGEMMIGLDLAPDNPHAPLWLREPGTPCKWRYGAGREI
mgnify:FL=1